MSQVTHGLRSIFSNPQVYDSFQNLMGASRMRRELVSEFVRPTPGMLVLDIGCGTAEIVHFLPACVDYWGYDVSDRYIDAAKAKFGARGRFHCGVFDAKQAHLAPKFDVAIAVGVLHHLDDAQASSLFELAKRAVKPGGRVVTIDPCISQGQNPIARFLIDQDRGLNVRTADAYRALPQTCFARIDGHLRHRSWVPYTHWVMECHP